MSISALASSIPAQQTFGIGAVGNVQVNNNAQTSAQNIPSQVGDFGPATQVDLSPQAQAMLAKAQALHGGATTAQNFSALASMNPAQRSQAQMLQSMGVSPQQMASMTLMQRQQVQAKVSEMMKSSMSQQTHNTSGVISSVRNMATVNAVGSGQ